MLCTGCDRDVPKKDRADGKCPHCGQRFVLDPQAEHGLTDKAFQAAVERVSGGGEVKFLPEHVWYEVGRVIHARQEMGHRKTLIAVFVVVGVVATALLTALLGPCGVALGPLLALVGWWFTRALLGRGSAEQTAALPLPLTALEQLWHQWKAVHRDIPGLMRRQQRGPARDPGIDPDELRNYSFDRVVVCDDARVVDLLVANRFHFENNCAILSEDGEPAAIFGLVREMVKNNPEIRVYVLHHCTPAGCGLAERLRSDPAWFRDTGVVIDVGLRPEHAEELRGAWERATSHIPTRDRPYDRTYWLERWELSLWAVRPEQLLRRLYRAITQAEQRSALEQKDKETPATADGVGGGVVVLPGFSGDAGPSEGDGDGFG